MPASTPQISSIVLPQIWVTGTETETINDLVTHPSIDIPVQYLQEKNIHIMAIEAVAAGVPGNLFCWIEVSPVPSTISTSYWTAIGGGGGPLDPATGLPYIPPVAPAILVALGVNLTVQSLSLPWVIYSPWARVVIQTPVAAALPNAFWVVQCQVTGKPS